MHFCCNLLACLHLPILKCSGGRKFASRASEKIFTAMTNPKMLPPPLCNGPQWGLAEALLNKVKPNWHSSSDGLKLLCITTQEMWGIVC